MISNSKPGGPVESKPLGNSQRRTTILKPIEEVHQRMEVLGSHRALFYRRSSRKHVPNYSTIVVDLEGNCKKVYFESESKEKKEESSLPLKSEKLATKGTQTDFRESEAQTVPWKHKIQAGEKLLAELLSLNWFSLEKNFPPGVKEVMVIEETRQKLAWENVIEKLKGRENDIKRKALVLRMSANENAFREERKEEENRERLENSRREMEEEQKTFEERLSSRLQKSYVFRRMENSFKIHYWKHQLARNIRKAKSARVGLSTKPDIIALHKDKSSILYAPKLREGGNTSLAHEVIDIQCRFLKRFHGLEFLEKHMANTFHPKLPKPPQNTQKSNSKKLEFSSGKYLGKEIDVAEEEMSENSSLKLLVPATTPEPATSSLHTSGGQTS